LASGVPAGRDTAQLDGRLRASHFSTEVMPLARVTRNRVFPDGSADELELPRVELDGPAVEDLSEEERAIEVSDREPVGFATRYR